MRPDPDALERLADAAHAATFMTLWDLEPAEAETQEETSELLAELRELTPAPIEVVPGQETLFGSDDDFTVAWPEWKGMPEFLQEDLTAWKSIILNFESRADMDTFSNLIGQNLTTRTRSIWYPQAEIGHLVDKRYRDTSADPKEETA